MPHFSGTPNYVGVGVSQYQLFLFFSFPPIFFFVNLNSPFWKLRSASKKQTSEIPPYQPDMMTEFEFSHPYFLLNKLDTLLPVLYLFMSSSLDPQLASNHSHLFATNISTSPAPCRFFSGNFRVRRSKNVFVSKQTRISKRLYVRLLLAVCVFPSTYSLYFVCWGILRCVEFVLTRPSCQRDRSLQLQRRKGDLGGELKTYSKAITALSCFQIRINVATGRVKVYIVSEWFRPAKLTVVERFSIQVRS